MIIVDLLVNKSSTLQQISKGQNISSTLKPNLISSRSYSTSSKTQNYSPEVIYPNADLEKESIIKENKKKSGVYLWKNLINGKFYIGSSVNLGRRFGFYFSVVSLMNYKFRSIIYNALLKNGYSNFSLEILEYCKPEEVIKREQFYIDLLKPEYNILQVAGKKLGRMQTKEAKIKISLSKKTTYNTTKGTASLSKPVEITDILTSKKTIYPSIMSAQAALKASKGSLNYVLKSKSGLYKKRYKVTLLPSALKNK